MVVRAISVRSYPLPLQCISTSNYQFPFLVCLQQNHAAIYSLYMLQVHLTLKESPIYKYYQHVFTLAETSVCSGFGDNNGD